MICKVMYDNQCRRWDYYFMGLMELLVQVFWLWRWIKRQEDWWSQISRVDWVLGAGKTAPYPRASRIPQQINWQQVSWFLQLASPMGNSNFKKIFHGVFSLGCPSFTPWQQFPSRWQEQQQRASKQGPMTLLVWKTRQLIQQAHQSGRDSLRFWSKQVILSRVTTKWLWFRQARTFWNRLRECLGWEPLVKTLLTSTLKKMKEMRKRRMYDIHPHPRNI